jgi:hypothetical protein
MRSAFRFSFFSFLFLCLTAQAQQKTNPHTQINWPASCNHPGMAYNWAANQCVTVPDISAVVPGPPALCANGAGGALTQTGCTIPAPQVAWPGSCTTGVYSPASNTCVAPGTAANPAAPMGSGQMNVGGIFGPLPGLTADPTNGYITAGGMGYAKGYQSGGGNNGIGNCFTTTGQTCVAAPDYGLTETYSQALAAAHTPGAQQAHFPDQRGGILTDYFMDPPLANDPGAGGYHRSHATVCSFTTPNTYSGGTGGVSGTYKTSCDAIVDWVSMPGSSLGSVPVGPNGWSSHSASRRDVVVNSPGISQLNSATFIKAGTGDNANYMYFYNYGGATAPADEVHEGTALADGEKGTVFTGTVSTVTDEQHLKTNCTADCGYQGDGRYLIKTTAPVLTSYITGHTAPSGFTPGNYTIPVSVTPSTFWGTLNADVITPVSPTITAPTNMTFVVNSGPGNTGAPSSTSNGGKGDLVCFNGQFHEQARITNVTGSGPWTITVPLRHAHPRLSWIMANGPCSSFIEFTANTQPSFPDNIPLKYPIDIIGATDATHLQYVWFAYGTGTLNWTIRSGNVVFAPLPVTSLSNAAGLVTMNGVGINNQYLSGTTVYITGASDAAFNGVCTNSTWNNLTNRLTCSQASSSGHTTAGVTGNVGLGPNGGNGDFNLWLGSEVLDVQNYNPPPLASGKPSPPIVDGTFLIEPNNMGLAVSDTVENSHHYASGYFHHRGTESVNNPVLQSVEQGYSLTAGGPGIVAGTLGVVNATFLNFGNANPFSMYLGSGGVQTPWGAITINGPQAYLANMLYAPVGIGSSGIHIGCPGTAAGCADFTQQYYPLHLIGAAGSTLPDGIGYRPASDETTILGKAVVLGSALGATQINDNLAFASVPSPVITVTPQTTNGTCGASVTRCYKAQARNAINSAAYSLPGAEVCRTSGAGTTNSFLIATTRIPGAFQWQVGEGPTTNSELLIPSSISSANTLQWLDDCTAATGGAMATVDNSLGGPTGMALFSLLSAGTAFLDTVKAAAGNAGAVSHTFPPSSGTIGLGLTIPAGTPTFTQGTNVTSCTCAASYTCTNTRGRLTIVGGTATTGTICTVTWSASLTAAPFFTLGEMGATSLHGLDHGVPTATSVTITAASTVSGATLSVDYETQP